MKHVIKCALPAHCRPMIMAIQEEHRKKLRHAKRSQCDTIAVLIEDEFARLGLRLRQVETDDAET